MAGHVSKVPEASGEAALRSRATRTILSSSRLGKSLTGLAILLKVSFKLQDDDVDQARGKWISHLPLQEPIARNLNF
jgi:hypothetical protein